MEVKNNTNSLGRPLFGELHFDTVSSKVGFGVEFSENQISGLINFFKREKLNLFIRKIFTLIQS